MEREIPLESCAELESIVVRTRNSVYELIVLSANNGDVMLRGGELFPEFCPATIQGATIGSSLGKLRAICVGMHMAFHVKGEPFLTTRVQAVSRHRAHANQNAA